MKRILLHTIVIVTVLSSFAAGQTITSAHRAGEFHFTSLLARARASRRAGFSLMPASHSVSPGGPVFSITPAAANLPVAGSGSVGRLTKWTGITSSNYFIGNSTIFEDKFGMVGIGTDMPTSRLTVVGMIETVSAGGGIKFADGTIQTTSATGALFSVSHDAMLMGNGTAASPLGLAVPLSLSGFVGSSDILGIINVTNLSYGGVGMMAQGADTNTGPGGGAVLARGGNSNFDGGGSGVRAIGGTSNNVNGGPGVVASGGNSSSSQGGSGVRAIGGESGSGVGGNGISASGGFGPGGNGLAGDFSDDVEIHGDLEVSGTLSKGGGSFKIDHPLDPENKYLYHSFVESPDMKNIYDGNVVTDANGEAVVELPAYLEALNRDFRYQLTVIGTVAQAIVAEKIKGNRFSIKTNAPNVEVSWQVTGIRQDAWANKNRIRVEVEKPDRERGHFLHPEAFDRPQELSIQQLKHPEMMKQRKETRQRAKPNQR